MTDDEGNQLVAGEGLIFCPICETRCKPALTETLTDGENLTWSEDEQRWNQGGSGSAWRVGLPVVEKSREPNKKP